jgi:hypothetical protein
MIIDSTPYSIRLNVDSRTVTFRGEWSSPYRVTDDGNLESTGEVSKFYMTVPQVMHWDPPDQANRLTAAEISVCLDRLLECASKKGWHIVVEQV